MNVGYERRLHEMTSDPRNDVNCPLCGSNIYGSKYSMDWECTNKDCYLNKTTAMELFVFLRRSMGIKFQ